LEHATDKKRKEEDHRTESDCYSQPRVFLVEMEHHAGANRCPCKRKANPHQSLQRFPPVYSEEKTFLSPRLASLSTSAAGCERPLSGYQLGGAITLTRFHTSSGMLFFQTTPSIRLNAGLDRAHDSTRSMILAP
jgi:hypothetical protein